MSLADIIILAAAVAAVIVFIVLRVKKFRKQKANDSCCGSHGCAGCRFQTDCGACEKKEKDEK